MSFQLKKNLNTFKFQKNRTSSCDIIKRIMDQMAAIVTVNNALKKTIREKEEKTQNDKFLHKFFGNVN